METQLLREENPFPDDGVLKLNLGDIYDVYAELVSKITYEPHSLQMEWNYYKDGKAWLCKNTFRKKTVMWLSVWSDCFKVSFFFTEKSKSGIEGLKIAPTIKESFLKSKNIGKLIPLVIAIKEMSQIDDVLKIIEFKKSIK
ncbi:MAG: DUF3788 domain-containing protein [Bacteroidales bacterium]|nr:DUF3788 domain-containing protein [Bacteroidales bacterium]